MLTSRAEREEVTNFTLTSQNPRSGLLHPTSTTTEVVCSGRPGLLSESENSFDLMF